MDGPKQLACAAILLIPLAGFAGCGTAGRPPVTRQEATPKPSPAAEPSPAPPDTPAAEAPPQPSSSPRTVDVVDPGGASSPPSLVQAAKAERERRAHAGEPVAVITDKTLPHLPKGQLTYAEPKKKTAIPAAPPSNPRDEQYWRGRALDIRTRWKKTAEEVKDLEQSAAGWRRRFYAENDPYARDSQVKPEWDRVLDRLGKARSEVETTRKELDDFMEEGRRAGALPGWLREGSEQEPVQDEKKDKGPGTLEPKEPSIYQQPPPPPENRGVVP